MSISRFASSSAAFSLSCCSHQPIEISNAVWSLVLLVRVALPAPALSSVALASILLSRLHRHRHFTL
jgi:hypothetical protein